MELYIKDDLSDISYQSELILDNCPNIKPKNCQGFNSQTALRPFDLHHYHSVSRLLIKGGAVKWLKKNL